MNGSCDEVRELIQVCRDENRSLPDHAFSHLARCRECLRYESFIRVLPAAVAGALIRSGQDLPDPDFRSIVRRTPARPRKGKARTLLLVAAASIPILLSPPIAWYRVHREREIRLVREETGLFLDDIFTRDLLPGVEFAGLDLGPEGTAEVGVSGRAD